MEVVGLLLAFSVFGCPIADLCQRFVGILIGVDISIPAVRVGFLQEVAAVPDEAGFLFEAAVPDEAGFLFEAAVCFQTAFAYPSAQGVVAVRPRFFRAVFLEDFGFNRLVVQVVEIVLHFAVCQLAVDEVAKVVVVIGRAVVGFQAVVGDGIEAV